MASIGLEILAPREKNASREKMVLALIKLV